jgi:ornithine cyclodeaminase/alanine dehydrogenase-like protein (mu-crystallin family)
MPPSTQDAVLAAERAYVAAATGRDRQPIAPAREWPHGLQARAAAGAVASRYLAVGTPRSFALIGERPAIVCSLDAHRVWFSPRDLRCTSPHVAAAIAGARVVGLDEALACDIVCIHSELTIAAHQLRRGTHVNALADVELDPELRVLATVVDEPHGLPALAAGLVDGRQLDEITIFIAGDASIAASVL